MISGVELKSPDKIVNDTLGAPHNSLANRDGVNHPNAADKPPTTYSGVLDQWRQPAAGKRGAIYYVSYGERGPIKIGFVNGFAGLVDRLRGLQTGCPHDLILLAVRAGTLADERALQCRVDCKRLRGEWFEPHRELLTHIRGVQRRKDCRQERPLHPQHALAPEGMKFLRHGGSRTWLVTA
jgi:hypothetical protein